MTRLPFGADLHGIAGSKAVLSGARCDLSRHRRQVEPTVLGSACLLFAGGSWGPAGGLVVAGGFVGHPVPLAQCRSPRPATQQPWLCITAGITCVGTSATVRGGCDTCPCQVGLRRRWAEAPLVLGVGGAFGGLPRRSLLPRTRHASPRPDNASITQTCSSLKTVLHRST
jgi:hypothetical protein